MRVVGPLLVLGALLVAGPVAAAEDPDGGARPDLRAHLPGVGAAPPATFDPPLGPGTGLPLARLGLAVAGIGALGWGVSAWARRRQGGAGDATARIEVLARRGIGPRHQLVLVEVGEHRLLVGMGGDGLRLVADLSESPGGGGFDAALRERLPEPPSPRELLQSIGPFQGLDA